MQIGDVIISKMIEIDQSNKTERLEKDTILAFSNQHQYTISIPSSIKRNMLDHLQAKGKDRKNACLWIFSAGVFLLLKPYLPAIIKQHEIIVVDTEYTGHEANIKSMILRHCYSIGLSLPAHQIRFDQIGKSSSAHKAAYNVQRGKAKVDKRIRLEEMLELM